MRHSKCRIGSPLYSPERCVTIKAENTGGVHDESGNHVDYGGGSSHRRCGPDSWEPHGTWEKFEEGFLLLGPTALSMAGIICLVPLLSKGLQIAIVPIYDALGLDAGMLGGILAIDMGGYQLAMELSSVSAVGRYAGIMVAATFGCTISFTIPVGMGMLEEEEKSCLRKAC